MNVFFYQIVKLICQENAFDDTDDHINSGGGGGVVVLLNRFPQFRCFTNFSLLLPIEYQIHIWQLSYDTHQIWKWSKEPNMHFCIFVIFFSGGMNEQSFSNPIPGLKVLIVIYDISEMSQIETLSAAFQHRQSFLSFLWATYRGYPAKRALSAMRKHGG